MDAPPSPAALRRMQIVSAGMLAGCVLFLGMLVLMRLTTERSGGLAVASYFALAVGVCSPLVAITVDRVLAARPPDPSSEVDRVVQRHLVTYGILEAGALFSGMALALAPDLLPLAAAAVPVLVMVVRFPRAS